MLDVVIIGGGAAGMLVAIHLLHGGGQNLRIVIVEPRARLGEGVAYSTNHPEHLLNVIASRMSAFDGAPTHFVEFLRAHPRDGQPVDGAAVSHSFAPRRDYARYLRFCLRTVTDNGRVDRVRDEVTEVDFDNVYTLRLRGGAALRSRHVVLATGNFPRALPIPVPPGDSSMQPVSAWDYDGVRAIARDSDVCIVGSGLSMVDAVVSLEASGHSGRIVVLSRHGLMPLPHAAPGHQATDAGALIGQSLSRRIRSLRKNARQAQIDGRPWQWTMDGVRHHTQALWQSLDATAQRRFLRHASRHWDIHRHRIAQSAAATLQRLRDSGRLQVFAARKPVIALDDASRCTVTFVERKSGMRHSLRVHSLINATGVESDVRRVSDPLIQSMLQRAAVRPGAHGIGMATDESGRLVGEAGESGIHTLGAARIGQLWESIAIPELRTQARAIARRILEQVRGDAR